MSSFIDLPHVGESDLRPGALIVLVDQRMIDVDGAVYLITPAAADAVLAGAPAELTGRPIRCLHGTDCATEQHVTVFPNELVGARLLRAAPVLDADPRAA